MRIQDIMRSMVDMIDGIESPQHHQPHPVVVIASEPEEQPSPLTHAGDDINRFKQIVDLAQRDDNKEYSNTPDEQYASIEAVTGHAGGGVNGPKDPSDIRGEHPSMYPAHQHGFKE